MTITTPARNRWNARGLAKQLPPALTELQPGSAQIIRRRGRLPLLSVEPDYPVREVEAVTRMVTYGWYHYWNRLPMPAKRAGMAWVGDYETPILPGEDPTDVLFAMWWSWLTLDTETAGADLIADRRFGSPPPIETYKRGQDMNMLLPNGHGAVVYSLPRRGPISVRPFDTDEAIEVASVEDLATSDLLTTTTAKAHA